MEDDRFGLLKSSSSPSSLQASDMADLPNSFDALLSIDGDLIPKSLTPSSDQSEVDDFIKSLVDFLVNKSNSHGTRTSLLARKCLAAVSKVCCDESCASLTNNILMQQHMRAQLLTPPQWSAPMQQSMPIYMQQSTPMQRSAPMQRSTPVRQLSSTSLTPQQHLPSVHSADLLKSLDALLANNTYIYAKRMTKQDLKYFAAVTELCKGGFPSLERWYNRVSRKLLASEPMSLGTLNYFAAVSEMHAEHYPFPLHWHPTLFSNLIPGQPVYAPKRDAGTSGTPSSTNHEIAKVYNCPRMKARFIKENTEDDRLIHKLVKKGQDMYNLIQDHYEWMVLRGGLTVEEKVFLFEVFRHQVKSQVVLLSASKANQLL